jgi:hypothetical protein
MSAMGRMAVQATDLAAAAFGSDRSVARDGLTATLCLDRPVQRCLWLPVGSRGLGARTRKPLLVGCYVR